MTGAMESVRDSLDEPRVFRTLLGEALEIVSTPYESVGKVFSDAAIEVVWVSKEAEEIDPDWHSQPTVDLMVVMQGKLRVEFERSDQDPIVLEPGDLLVIPPGLKCRAYRWPRKAGVPTVFVAAYPRCGSESRT